MSDTGNHTPQSPFIYLLNKMEGAAQSENPFERGYGDKRQAVLDYVAKLEASVSETGTNDSLHRKALEEIMRGRGPFSSDPLKHAQNCIEEMKRVAIEALAGTWRSEE